MSEKMPAATLEALIERLERATGPDRELDTDIARALYPEMKLGTIRNGQQKAWFLHGERVRVEDYTASLDAAMTLVPKGAEYEITTLYGVARVAVGLNMEPGPYYASREDGNVTIALCIAAIKARSA